MENQKDEMGDEEEPDKEELGGDCNFSINVPKTGYNFKKRKTFSTLSDTSSQIPKPRKMDNSKAAEDNPPSQDTLLLQRPPSLPQRTPTPTKSA
ncbi:hypothetical protein A6R68_19592 [Neotoma lepida]|uniref:Uncharacterized protein n=1 Tax=Neotoma lepida TaxID=56216 RepID=A0A1A6HIG0_NEOLE|nr:hypothetical protein A6R68_19592 [Neotoma lepida]